MTAIIATSSGTEALCGIFSKAAGRIFLPSDICSSVLEGCERIGVTPAFYPVRRGWAVKADRYMLPPARSGDLVVVSDLFNFHSIDLQAVAGRQIVLDLAHCSFATAAHYLGEVAAHRIAVDIVGVVFSFGRGKYLRRGGGGCLVSDVRLAGPADIEPVLLQLERDFGPSPQYGDCDLRGLFAPSEISVNAQSTRMVIRPADLETGQEKIEQLRRIWKLDISDGLYEHLSARRSPEFYVWKRVTS